MKDRIPNGSTEAYLNLPDDVFVDSKGDIYIADSDNSRVRKVDAKTGIISTIAGGGSSSVLGSLATSFALDRPVGISLDESGNIFILCTNELYKVDAKTRIISAVPGKGKIRGPSSLFLGNGGEIYVAAREPFYGYSQVSRIDNKGIINKVAGQQGSTKDNIPATEATLEDPSGIFVDGAGNLYITEETGYRVRKVDAKTGTITTIAGTGEATFGGDDGRATDARLDYPIDIFLHKSGNLYIAENFRIRRVDPSGIIKTVVGRVLPGKENIDLSVNDVVVDTLENIYVSSKGLGVYRLDKRTGSITTILDSLHVNGMFLDDEGNIFAAETSSNLKENRVWKLNTKTGSLSRVAGGGYTSLGDGSLATEAMLKEPSDIFVDAVGNLYISDTGNSRIRKVDARTKVIMTVASNLQNVVDVFVDTAGSIYTSAFVKSELKYYIFKIEPSGSIQRLTTGDGVFVDKSGNVYVADKANGLITLVKPKSAVVTREIALYRISDTSGTPNSENPGKEKLSFQTGDVVRVTLKATNSGQAIPVQVVLNIALSNNHPNPVYDSHQVNQDNTFDSPLNNGETDYYSFDWKIPLQTQGGSYDIIAALRDGSNWDVVYDDTNNGPNTTSFGPNAWKSAFTVIIVSPPSRILGTIYSDVNSRPISNVVVELYRTGGKLNPDRKDTTDAQGKFSFEFRALTDVSTVSGPYIPGVLKIKLPGSNDFVETTAYYSSQDFENGRALDQMIYIVNKPFWKNPLVAYVR